eukprot:6607617-Prymnesium_polylepis.1
MCPPVPVVRACLTCGSTCGSAWLSGAFLAPLRPLDRRHARRRRLGDEADAQLRDRLLVTQPTRRAREAVGRVGARAARVAWRRARAAGRRRQVHPAKVQGAARRGPRQRPRGSCGSGRGAVIAR